MNFPSISLKHVLASLGCLFITVVVFVSILGENNNGVNAARIFLTAVKERDQAELQRSYSRSAKEFASREESTRYHFMVELAMLDHFKLLDQDDYRLDINADSIWFPFISGKKLHMNVKLTPMDGGGLFEGDGQVSPIERALVAIREDGRWKIEGFNLEDSPLKEYHQKVVDRIDYDKFLAIDRDEITLNTGAYAPGEMSGLDRMVFIHSLENAIEKVRNNS